jgi:membrane associated rhomboid family serine protease
MSPYGQSYRFEIGAGMTTAVKYLIIANFGCFLLQNLSGSWLSWAELVPAQVVHQFAVWQLVTYMFLHGGPWHIIINMLMLWMIGCEIERYWGAKQFLLYYFICGIGAGVCQTVIQILFFNPHASVIGASGAVYGLLMAFGILFSDRMITLLILFILPVHIMAKYLVMIMAVLSLLLGVFGDDSGVAHFAHLGGMLVGFVYLKFDWRWRVPGRKSARTFEYSSTSGGTARGLPALKNWFRQRAQKRRHMEVVRRRQRELHLRERVDAILDKINEVGYENLSDEEKQILRRASQSLSRENLRSQDYGPN